MIQQMQQAALLFSGDHGGQSTDLEVVGTSLGWYRKKYLFID